VGLDLGVADSGDSETTWDYAEYTAAPLAWGDWNFPTCFTPEEKAEAPSSAPYVAGGAAVAVAAAVAIAQPETAPVVVGAELLEAGGTTAAAAAATNAAGAVSNATSEAAQGLEKVSQAVPDAVARSTILSTDWTSLGKWPTYLQRATQMGASALDIDMDEWKSLGTRANQWAVNQAFLDDAMSKGNSFLLASPFQVGFGQTGTFYHDELMYILQKGYEMAVVDGQQWLLNATAER
jgi:hypothetical protein